MHGNVIWGNGNEDELKGVSHLRRYFEGWYFKQQNSLETVALIPAVHADNCGRKKATIQAVTSDGAYCYDVPDGAFTYRRKPLEIHAGKCFFNEKKILLDAQSDNCNLLGELSLGTFGSLKYDIMGPFQLFPFMECRHTVLSMMHDVVGVIQINGKEYHFDHHLGYIEGDRGRSFPNRYIWTQCTWLENEPCSLMISLADIPYMGMSFTGVIAVVLINDREYRLATYLGAKPILISKDQIIVKQGAYTLSAQRLDQGGMLLKAPVMGGMTRMIHEAPACRVMYRLIKGDRVLLDTIQDQAGYEYEYSSE